MTEEESQDNRDSRDSQESREASPDERFKGISRDMFYVASPNPSDQIALTSALLGLTFGCNLILSFTLEFYPLPVYLMSLTLFHFLEYWITARYNQPKVSIDCKYHSTTATKNYYLIVHFSHQAFLLRNGSSYIAAHLFALIECLIELWLVPSKSRPHPYFRGVGIVFVIIGQIVRSFAMIQASTNFSHIISRNKEEQHQLVTWGLYRFLRHPSYFGFFYWALGTQFFLANPISIFGFAAVLWVFFRDRIQDEEDYLLTFFGEDYANYKKTTGTGIPFIR